MITQECMDELGTNVGLHPGISNNGIQSPSKVPKEALFPGLSPLVESSKAPSPTLLHRYHKKIIAAHTKSEKPSSDAQILQYDVSLSAKGDYKSFSPPNISNISKEAASLTKKYEVGSKPQTESIDSPKICEDNTYDKSKETVSKQEPISSKNLSNKEENLIDFSDPPTIENNDCSNFSEKTEICKTEPNENENTLKNLRIERLPKPFNVSKYFSGQSSFNVVYPFIHGRPVLYCLSFVCHYLMGSGKNKLHR